MHDDIAEAQFGRLGLLLIIPIQISLELLLLLGPLDIILSPRKKGK